MEETGESGMDGLYGKEMTDAKTVEVLWEGPSLWSRQGQGHPSMQTQQMQKCDVSLGLSRELYVRASAHVGEPQEDSGLPSAGKGLSVTKTQPSALGCFW